MIASQAAEKIYRSAGLNVQINVALAAESDAWLEYLPQETILFDGAKLARTTSVDAMPGSQVLAGEIIIFGRRGSGESFQNGFLSESLAGTLMSIFYAILSGIGIGKLHSQWDAKKSAGYPLYNFKNPVVHFTPLFIGSTLIIAGLLRIGWAFDFIITPLRLFSGTSLVLFGLVSFTLYITPHLRTQGILIIDHSIDWKTFLDYSWLGEDEDGYCAEFEDESVISVNQSNPINPIQSCMP